MTAAQVLDLIPFVQYGAMGVVVAAFITGWLVPRHVLVAQQRQVDELRERLNRELLPEADRLTTQYRELVGTLTPAQLDNALRIAPELELIAPALLKETDDEIIPVYEAGEAGPVDVIRVPSSYAPRRSLPPPPEPPRAGEPTMNLLEGAEPFPVKRPDPTIVTDGRGRRVRPIPEGRTEVVGGRRTRPAGAPPRGYRLMRWVGGDFPGLFDRWLRRRIMADYDRERT